MIKVEVCTECNAKDCCDFKDGIDLYEFLKSYLKEFFSVIDMEINITRCKCMKQCDGPVVKVNNRIYTSVDRNKALEIIRDLLIIVNKEKCNK